MYMWTHITVTVTISIILYTYMENMTFWSKNFDPKLTCTCVYVHKIILIKCLLSITSHFIILHRKPMEFGIQKELLLSFLNTKFHWLPVQNYGIMSDRSPKIFLYIYMYVSFVISYVLLNCCTWMNFNFLLTTLHVYENR